MVIRERDEIGGGGEGPWLFKSGWGGLGNWGPLRSAGDEKQDRIYQRRKEGGGKKKNMRFCKKY